MSFFTGLVTWWRGLLEAGRPGFVLRLGLAAGAALLAAIAPIAEPIADKLTDPALPAALPLGGRLQLVGEALAHTRLALAFLLLGALAGVAGRRPRFGGALGAASAMALVASGIARTNGSILPASAYGAPVTLLVGGIALLAIRPRRAPALLLLVPMAVVAAALAAPFPRSLLAALRPVPLEGPDILLVVMDTTRTDALEPYGGPPTPAIAAFAGRAAVYDNAVSTAPWTLPSHGSFFTGLLPSEHGATYATWRLRPDVPTLAERLDALGYDTFATSGNPVVSAATGLARGFQRFDETYADGAATAFTWTELRRALYPVRGSVAERQTNAAVEVLSRRRRRPAFVFVNYFEPHGPYEPEDGRRRALPNVPGARPDRELIAESGLADLPMLVATQLLRWSPADLRRERQLYDAEVASVDAELSRLLAAAGSHGDRPALVVLTSDHGEHFGEQGRAGHMFSLGEALLHVPLLISDPRRPELAGRRLPRLVSLRELPGFLLGAARGEPSPELGQAGLAVAELDVPHDLLDGFAARHAGVDLSALRRGGRALRREGWKLLALDGEPAPRLFDLAAGGEERDVAALEPALAAEAARELDRLIPPRLAGGRERAPLDPATKERLRALGYLR